MIKGSESRRGRARGATLIVVWFPKEIRNALYAQGIRPEDVIKLRWEQERHENPRMMVRLRPEEGGSEGQTKTVEISLAMAEHGGLSSPL